MKNKHRLIDFQKQWGILVDKAINDYSALSKAERLWYNVECLINVVNNGGMISFFYNLEGKYYSETIEDLKELNQKKVIKLLEKISEIFPDKIVPKDCEKRNEIINSMPDGKYDKKFERIDEQFFELEDKLEEDLINFINTHKLI